MDEMRKKLQQVKVAICHKDCPDGIASAMFLKDALPGIEIRFVQYGTPEWKDLTPEPNVLFCDISPGVDTYKGFVDAGALILDHHKGAEDIVKAFGDNGVFGDEIKDPGVCGAYLAYREVWRHFRVDATVSEQVMATKVARLSGIRDTWQRQDPDWEEACQLAEAMKFFPEWPDRPFTKPEMWAERIQVGSILINNTRRAAARALEDSHRFITAKGTKVAMFPGTRLSSDVADLDTESDLIVGFGFAGVKEGEVTLVFSTRTRKDFDCGGFCKTFSGGGHTKAAGFSVKHDVEAGGESPYNVIKRLLGQYESNSILMRAVSITDRPGYEMSEGVLSGDFTLGRSLHTSEDLEKVRLYKPFRSVKIEPACLGLDSDGNPKFPKILEVWV